MLTDNEKQQRWPQDHIIARPLLLFSSRTFSLAIFGIMIWLHVALQVGKMNQIARCDWLPEWSHLACSGLPTVSHKKGFFESHINNKSHIDHVCSVKPDIGHNFFALVYGP